MSRPYSSKLDDFEDFISHAKLSTLPLQLSHVPAAPVSGATQRFNSGKSTASLGKNAITCDEQSVSQTALQAGGAMRKLLLIEDMPHYADLLQRQRLANLLGEHVALGCSYFLGMSCQHLPFLCMHDHIAKLPSAPAAPDYEHQYKQVLLVYCCSLTFPSLQGNVVLWSWLLMLCCCRCC